MKHLGSQNQTLKLLFVSDSFNQKGHSYRVSPPNNFMPVLNPFPVDNIGEDIILHPENAKLCKLHFLAKKILVCCCGQLHWNNRSPL